MTRQMPTSLLSKNVLFKIMIYGVWEVTFHRPSHNFFKVKPPCPNQNAIVYYFLVYGPPSWWSSCRPFGSQDVNIPLYLIRPYWRGFPQYDRSPSKSFYSYLGIPFPIFNFYFSILEPPLLLRFLFCK